MTILTYNLFKHLDQLGVTKKETKITNKMNKNKRSFYYTVERVIFNGLIILVH